MKKLILAVTIAGLFATTAQANTDTVQLGTVAPESAVKAFSKPNLGVSVGAKSTTAGGATVKQQVLSVDYQLQNNMVLGVSLGASGHDSVEVDGDYQSDNYTDNRTDLTLGNSLGVYVGYAFETDYGKFTPTVGVTATNYHYDRDSETGSTDDEGTLRTDTEVGGSGTMQSLDLGVTYTLPKYPVRISVTYSIVDESISGTHETEWQDNNGAHSSSTTDVEDEISQEVMLSVGYTF